MGKKLAFGIAIASVVAYMLHVPFPDECDCPWQIKLRASLAHILEKMGALNVMLGGSFASPYKMVERALPESVPGIEILELQLGGVPVTMFRPDDFGKTGRRAAMIYFHGGGWTIGSVGSYAPVTIKMAKKIGMLLVVPEYRLAPEHPFPAAYDDCLKVTEEFLKNAEKYDVDPKKVVLSGDSAGGNLVITISLELGMRDRDRPNPICMANPIYPGLQIGNFRLPSYLQNAYMPMLSRDAVANFVLNYAGLGSNRELIPMLISNKHMEGYGDDKFWDRISEKWVPQKFKTRREIDDRGFVLPDKGVNSLQKHRKKFEELAADRRLAPLTVDDKALETLPRTHLISCEYDVLRDDAIILHERMKKLGLQVSWDHWEFAIHGTLNGYGVVNYDKLDKAMDQMLETILRGIDQC